VFVYSHAASAISWLPQTIQIQILEVRAFDVWVGTIDPLAWYNWFMWLDMHS
jgi:hypothetical protein